MLYNNTNHTHTHTHTEHQTEGMGRAVKHSLEIIIKQVRLEGGFERGGRIRVAECLRQIVPDSCSVNIQKRGCAVLGLFLICKETDLWILSGVYGNQILK